MYCDGCGATIEGRQKFCSKCGKPIAGVSSMPAPMGAANRIAANLKVVAILWMVLSVITCLIPGLFLILSADVAANFFPPDVPAFVFPLLHGIGIFLLCGAAIGLLAGWGLLEGQPWARMLAIVLAFLNLLHIPFGTALGIYTLWVLLPAQSEAEYRQLSLSGPAL
jgi:hypothetical protein